MSDGNIPIINTKGKVVANFVWTGGLVSGSGELKATKGNSSIAKQIEELVKDSDYLEGATFRSVGKDVLTVKGWEGFEGNWQGFSIVLEQIGLLVDDAKVDIPKDEYDGKKLAQKGDELY